MKKIGMRTIKTGIAVTLSILLSEMGFIKTPTLTVSACIMSMKNTVKLSLEYGLSRILGTLLGGFLGFIFAYIFGGNYWFTGLGVIVAIHLCFVLKFSSGAIVSSLTFASILMGVGNNNPLIYSVDRTIDSMFGVIIALGVNFWLSRKKYIRHLYAEYLHTESKFLELAREISRDKKFHMHDQLQDELENLNKFYDQLVDEVNYYKKDIDLSTLTISIDLCTQIFYHLYGIHVVSQQFELDKDIEIYSTMQQYHRKCIRKLLYEVRSESVGRCSDINN